MKSVLKVAAFAIGLSTLATAQAQVGPYIGANLSRVEVEHANLTSIGYKLGFQTSHYLALEARLGTGLFDSSINGVTYEVDNYAGAYAKFILPLNHNFSVYAVGGYTRAELKAYTGKTILGDWSETDFSSGLGMDIAIDQRTSINMEWINLIEDVDLLSFGVNYSF